MRRAFVFTLPATLATNALIGAVHTFEPRSVAIQAPMFVLLGFLATVLTIAPVAKRAADTR